MKIVAVDPQARVLSEQEILALLREPILMRLWMVDGHGWPVVMPVWHVFEGGVFRIVAGKTSHKANVLRANQRAYFTVDPVALPEMHVASEGAPTRSSSTATSRWPSTWLGSKAYQAGIPGNGQPFPDGSKSAKIQWRPKKVPRPPLRRWCRTPLKDVAFIAWQEILGQRRMGIRPVQL
jgi:hypothetical protein